LDTPHQDTVYLREQDGEDAWLVICRSQNACAR